MLYRCERGDEKVKRCLVDFDGFYFKPSAWGFKGGVGSRQYIRCDPSVQLHVEKARNTRTQRNPRMSRMICASGVYHFEIYCFRAAAGNINCVCYVLCGETDLTFSKQSIAFYF